MNEEKDGWRVEVKKPKNQHCTTPQDVVSVAREFFQAVHTGVENPMALDPCWNPYAVTDAEFVCDGVEVDGLAADWGACVRAAGGGGTWVNPVWKDTPRWVAKVIAEATANPFDMDICLHLPLYPETKAAQLIWKHASRICLWGERVNHPMPPIDPFGNLILGGETVLGAGAFNPVWISYFGAHSAAFEAAFGKHGTVLWGWNPQDAGE